MFQEWDDDGSQARREDAIGADSYSSEAGGERVLGYDTGGPDAATCGTCGEPSGRGFSDVEQI